MGMFPRPAPLMRLVDADPVWAGANKNGVVFECPIHTNCSIGIFFKEPIEPGECESDIKLWNRTGNTFETLTISPSICLNGEGCQWHGFIRDGQFEHCGDAK